MFTKVTSITTTWWLRAYNNTTTIEIKELPPNLKTGADGCFWGIRGSLTIPASFSTINGAYPFGNKNGALIELIMKGMTPPSISGTLYIQPATKYIYVPDDAIETYKTASKWSNYASKIKGISERLVI